MSTTTTARRNSLPAICSAFPMSAPSSGMGRRSSATRLARSHALWVSSREPPRPLPEGEGISLSSGPSRRREHRFKPQPPSQRTELVSGAAYVPVLGPGANPEPMQHDRDGIGYRSHPVQTPKRRLGAARNIGEFELVEPRAGRETEELITCSNIRNRPAREPAVEEVFVSGRVGTAMPQVLDDSEPAPGSQDSTGFAKELLLLGRVAHTLDR